MRVPDERRESDGTRGKNVRRGTGREKRRIGSSHSCHNEEHLSPRLSPHAIDKGSADSPLFLRLSVTFMSATSECYIRETMERKERRTVSEA